MRSFRELILGSLLEPSIFRIIGSIVFIILASYLGLALYLYLFQTTILYFPTFTIDRTPASIGLDYQEVWMPVNNGHAKVHGWSIPAAADHDRGRWVLFCHGNAGNIGDRLTMIELLHRLGFSTLIFDYRGFGRSSGRPSEKNTYEDAAAAWRWLLDEAAVEPRQIMVFGRSLGGAVAAWLAQEKNPGLLVVESTFTSIAEMGRLLYPWMPVAWLVRYNYPTREYLAAYQGAVLIMHSRDDEMMPMAMGRELYRVAPGPKRMVELRGGHNEVWYVMGEEYEKRLIDAVEQLWP